MVKKIKKDPLQKDIGKIYFHVRLLPYLTHLFILTFFYSLFCFSLFSFFQTISHAKFRPIPQSQFQFQFHRDTHQTHFSRKELAQEIIKRLERVEEFREIKKFSEKLGVKAYLFGGTAAAYAHYVKWDLLREKGDTRFQKHRFDYDYTNIFRSNQDMDIVLDGTPKQAAELEAHLAAKFPFFQGNKTVWEVRLLSEARGDKEPLLNNRDFLDQHTDSNSTGMIEISGDDLKGRIRDLREWDKAENSHFFDDIYHGKLHYYFSENHQGTKRFKEGLNPPIISVIRYLTKAFQYELEIPEDSLKKIQLIIDQWKDADFQGASPYVQYWIEKNGRKLIQNAVNIEYAWKKLEELGLREKLRRVGRPETNGLGWWMNKAPLTSDEVGKGQGKTAQELGLNIVAHETNSFDAYESMTRAHTGEPNVLISRDGYPGEAASFGDGFYTAEGTKGMRGTGITIRFKVNPKARNQTDFIQVGNGIVIFLNKKALEVIPETLNLSMVEFFEKLANREILFDFSDRAVQEKVNRRLRNQSTQLEEKEVQQLASIVQKIDRTDPYSAVLEEWLKVPASCQFPQILLDLVKDQKTHKNLLQVIMNQLKSSNHSSCWAQDSRLIEAMIENGKFDVQLARDVLSQKRWKERSDWVEKLLDQGNADREIVISILSKDYWPKRRDWVEKLIDRGKADASIPFILSHDFWINHPDLVEKLIGQRKADREILTHVLSKKIWAGHPELVAKLIEQGQADGEVAKHILSKEYWQAHPEWVEKIIDRGTANSEIIQYVLGQKYWTRHPEFVAKLIKQGKFDFYIAEYIFSQESWKEHPELLKKLIDQGEATITIMDKVLSKKHWQKHPEFVLAILKQLFKNKWQRTRFKENIHSLLNQEHWKHHEGLKILLKENYFPDKRPNCFQRIFQMNNFLPLEFNDFMKDFISTNKGTA